MDKNLFTDSEINKSTIFRGYSLVALIYCFLFSGVFLFIAEDLFLGLVHIVAGILFAINWILYKFIKKIKYIIFIFLSIGLILVTTLFITGGWNGSGFIAALAYIPYAGFLAKKERLPFWLSSSFMVYITLATLSYLGTYGIRLPYSSETIISILVGYVVIAISIAIFKEEIYKNEGIVETERSRFINFIESIGDGVVAIDRNWNITLWNKEAAEISGWKKEEVIGKPFRSILKFIKENDRTENINFIEEAMVKAKPVSMSGSTLLVTRSGEEIPVGDSAAPIIGVEGEIEGAIVIFRNIAVEKDTNMLKLDFAYASHQLRTPVTNALWSIEVAMEEKNMKKVKEKLETAYQSVRTLEKINEELINVSRLDQGRIVPKKEDTQLVFVLENVKREVEPLARLKDISIEISSPPVIIKTDQTRLQTAIYAVVENAVNYNKEGGNVKIEVAVQQENILVNVTDTGIGIPEGEQPMVFTKFFRGRNFDSTKIIGAGLGLYIAREYIKLFGGKIWFESEKDEGTKFHIMLPTNQRSKI